MGAALVAAGLGLGIASAALAQGAATIENPSLTTRGLDGKPVPNFGGFYYPDATVAGTNGPNDQTRPRNRDWGGFNGYSTNGNTPPPLTPEYAKKYAEMKAATKEGELDFQEAKCRWPLFFDYYAYNEIWDILQREDELVMINKRQRAAPRHILIGGTHPAEEDLLHTPNGHAVAHWEGKVLVVDTVGTTDDTWLIRRDRLTHSDKLHIVERMSISEDGQVLTIAATIEDPEVFSKPWPLTVKFRKAKWGSEPIEEECNVDAQIQ